MCSFKAMRANVASKILYKRLMAKGKNLAVALIALYNKLHKQAFAIVKSSVLYRQTSIKFKLKILTF